MEKWHSTQENVIYNINYVSARSKNTTKSTIFVPRQEQIHINMTSEKWQQDFKYLPSVEHDMEWGLVVSCVGHHHIAAGEAYPPPQHPASYSFHPEKGRILDEFQLVFHTKGKGTFRSDTFGDTNVSEGDMLMLFPGERHTYFPSKSIGWDEYWIGFKGPNIESRVKHHFFSTEHPLFHIPVEERNEVIRIFQNAIGVAHQMGKGYQQLLAGYVNMLLGIVSSHGTCPLHDYTNETSHIHKAMLFIHYNYMKDLHPEEVSEHIGWGYSRFRKVFMQQTGTTPYQYILETRIKQSKNLLLNTSMALKEIAYEVGFSSPDYFSTAFRRIVGMSPLAFRKGAL